MMANNEDIMDVYNRFKEKKLFIIPQIKMA